MKEFNSMFFLKNKNQFIHTSDLPNRASFFGDGIFETFIFENSKIKFGAYHYDRALMGCEVLGLNKRMLTSLSALENLIKLHVGNHCVRVRWNVFRGGLGKYTPEENSVVETLYLQPYIKAPEFKSSAYFSNQILVPPSPWSHCKTLNALTYVMAGRERVQKGFDEVILMNSQGNICEAGASNLFWVKDQAYYTPSLSENCIAGIGRRVVIEKLKILNLPIFEGEFNMSHVLDADHVFTTNVTGISSILMIENRNYETLNDKFLLELF